MTETEAKKILATLYVAFPRDASFMDPESKKARDSLYLAKFLPFKFEGMAEAAHAWIETRPHFPTLGELLAVRSERQRPRPELSRAAAIGLPPTGETMASAEEVRTAVAKAIAVVTADDKRGDARKAAEVEIAALAGKLPLPPAAS